MADFATVAMQELRRKKRREQTAIPEPYEDIESLYRTVSALKELVETLAGQRGAANDVAVTWKDLLTLQLISKADIPREIGSD